jgi:osomolarity two-component system phosphorelay intermediate protein YPD1
MASTAATSAAERDPKGSEAAASTVEPGDITTMSTSVIDMDIFGQLLEMDDEEDREFSKEIVWNYFDQAESTFEKMDTAL